MIRVLVVDDSIFMRRVLSDAINKEPDLEVCGMASNGNEALAKAKELRPDVVTLDIEMPVRNGLEALRDLMRETPVPVVMLSTLTATGADATIIALELGAVDFACKPESLTQATLATTFSEIVPKIRVAAESRAKTQPVLEAAITSVQSAKPLLIASSTGGPGALMTLFRSLPKKMEVPCVIVQHMPIGFTKSLAARLDTVGAFQVVEAQHGDILKPGLAYVAPAGQHLEFAKNCRISLVNGEPRNGVTPAADYMFESAATRMGGNALGVILTGMGKDGTEGAVALKQAGGTIFGESEDTCVVYGMPRSAKAAGGIDAEFPIHLMGGAICKALAGERFAAA